MDIQEIDRVGLSKVVRKSPKMPLWAGKLFRAYATGGQIGGACAAAGISRQAHLKQLKNNPAYAAAFEEIRIEAGWVFEDLLVRRVLDGDYDFQAHHVLLKRFLPEVYRDRATVDVNLSVADMLTEARSRVITLLPPNDRTGTEG